ncbi:sulfatase-like hydrolase/transferase [Corynebacterium sp. 3HC-13]|uniref:sulfatase-like hydrolase/transferase n=1 Tax=Corynebacterium poyangense TaxID=2684405 RepID=UPI001CC98247|nr:sulfatase-like hydrolase/transferase [Corynebacterium poyangense]MBZ8177668.1 sulfatase-like hydrolase/transferase [Corynebacterium poyangense]
MSVFFIQLAQWLVASVVYWILASTRKTPLRLWKSVSFGVNTVIITFLITVFAIRVLPYGLPHPIWFYFLYFGGAIGVALCGVGIFRAVMRRRSPQAIPHSRLLPAIIWAILGGFIAAFAALGFFISNWFHQFFGELSVDQLVFVVTSGNGESTAVTDAQINNYMIAPVFMLLVIGLQVPIWCPTYTRRLLSILGITTLAVASTGYAFAVLPLSDLGSMNSTSEFLADNYVNPRDTVTFPAKKRNFIHIYMESVENSYYDRDHGGYDDRNYMPDLLKLNEKSVHFSHTDTMGGPHQTFGSVHSVAAMINMEAGVPMKTSIAGGTAEAMFYPKFPTMGELLHDNGYNTELMMGADASWGGLGDYYREHGDFLVFDHAYAINHGYLPEGYKEWWGYEDDKIYEFAKREITRLSQQPKPFYFILENADTHFPDGYKSPKITEEPFDTQYGNVIFYSQAQVMKFVQWVQQQPFAQDTSIMIVGDHRSMDKAFFDGWDKDYERTIVNMILNPAIAPPPRERMHRRDFAPFDLFPTALAAIGANIKNDRAGIGTNLFSGRKTLIEEHGLQSINDALAKRSEFYFDFRQ